MNKSFDKKRKKFIMSPEIKKVIGRFQSRDNTTVYSLEDENKIQMSYYPHEGPKAFWEKDFERLVDQAAKHFNISKEEIMTKLESGDTIKW